MMSSSVVMIIIIAVSAIFIFGMVFSLLKRYKRCSADELLVISGKVKDGKSSEVIHGGARFIWPVIQEWHTLDLKPMSMEIDLKGALSSQNIRVNVPSSVTFSISNQSGVMENAATHLLGLSKKEIETQASDIIFGQMRQVISSMSIEEINSDRDSFISNIQKNLTQELSKIGLKLINVNIKDIRDESGYIDAIGKEAAAKAINEASVKVAEERRKGEIGSSRADQVRRTEVSEANAQAEIGEAEADSRNRIKQSEANARAVDGENSALIEIAKSDANRKVAQAESNRISLSAEKVQRAKAEEEGLRQEKSTEDMRALKNKSTLNADQIIPAQVAKEKLVIEAQADAEQIRERAKGQADAKFSLMEAEAKGIYEILSNTANGFKSIVDSCGGNVNGAIQMMLTDKMPELMKIQMEAIKGIEIDKITVWDNGGNGSGSGNSTSDFIQNFLKSAPQYKDIYSMVGNELPKLLQGAGEIKRAEDGNVEVDDTKSKGDGTTQINS